MSPAGWREYPQLTSRIVRLRIPDPAPADRNNPGGRCGFNIWAEFRDRETAVAFARDFEEFARSWDPDEGGSVSRAC